VAACVELFHATMAGLYDGLAVPADGGGAWWTGRWTGSMWTGVRYSAAGAGCVFRYSPGELSAHVGYALESLGSWEEVCGEAGQE